MLVEANLKTTLIALGVKTTNVVKQLTEGDAVAVYEGERDRENDAQVMERYEKAVEAYNASSRRYLSYQGTGQAWQKQADDKRRTGVAQSSRDPSENPQCSNISDGV